MIYNNLRNDKNIITLTILKARSIYNSNIPTTYYYNKFKKFSFTFDQT